MRNETTGEPKADRIFSGEAARILGCSVPLVHYLEKRGRLVATRIGQVRVFDRGDVERLAIERAFSRPARRQLETDTP